MLQDSPENRPRMAYVVVPHDDDVGFAGELLDHSTDLVVVYDSNLEFAGVITSSEIHAHRAANVASHEHPVTAGAIMKTNVITCTLYDDPKKVLAKLRAQKQELVFILGRDRQFLKAADAGEVAGILRPMDGF